MEKSTLDNLLEKKTKILEMIKERGPLLPSAISNKINLSLLFTSAVLSEMKADKTLKISNIKVGGSPLYYLSGQEEQLENFINHLPQKEKEAFELLKRKQVVNEDKAEPAHRVAFRSMKDFAVPINVKFQDKELIFWRFHSIPAEEASKKIGEVLKVKKKERREEKKEVKKVEKEEVKEEKKEEKPEEKKEEVKKEEAEGEKPVKKKKVSVSKQEFRKKAVSWIESKGLSIVKELEFEETPFIVSTKSDVGQLGFLVFLKKKKSINEADLGLAYQRGQEAKMPVLFLTTGNLTKKASSYLESLGKFIIVNSI